jgi:serine/threonine protein kinase
MIYKTNPFFHQQEARMSEFKKSETPITFPEHPQISDDLKDFLRRILERNVRKRIGWGGASRGAIEIRKHPWLSSFNFSSFAKKENRVIFTPKFLDPTEKFDYIDEEVEFLCKQKIDVKGSTRKLKGRKYRL